MAKRRAPGTARRADKASQAPRRPADTRHDTALAIALWSGVALLVLVRAALVAVPGMGWWSLNILRFVHPVAGWLLWSLALLGLVPAVARRIHPALESAGTWMRRAPVVSTLTWALGAALVVIAIPDRAHFVGDFQLRESTLSEQIGGKAWYPQALPLDLAVHERLAQWFMVMFGLDANGVGRLIGAIEAGLLGALACRFTQVLDLRGAAALAAASVVLWGGYLTLFTGYNKAFSEMAVVTLAAGVFGLEILRHGRGYLAFGIVFGLGLLLHRSALGLAPLAAMVWTLGLRGRGRGGAWRRPGVIAAALFSLAALVAMTPRIVGIVTGIDTIHFAPESVRAAGWLAATFGDGRPLDMLNLIVMLSPLAISIPILGVWLVRSMTKEAWTLVVLAAPFLLALPFIHPGQGYLRDWDDFASAGVAMSLVAAWLVAKTLDRTARWPWLATTVTLGAVVPSFLWLLHGADLGRGLARARAFMEERPDRPVEERYTTWMYLGVRYAAADSLDASARAYARASEAIETPHILHQWGTVEMARGDLRGARRVYERLVERNPRDTYAWSNLALARYGLRDLGPALEAAHRVLELDSTRVQARQVIAAIQRAHSDSGRVGP